MPAETLRELTALTCSKARWPASFPFVISALDDPACKVQHKALFLLGEMGLAHPALVTENMVAKIISFWSCPDEKLRAQAVCAMGRIGRSDYELILPYLPQLLSLRSDPSEKVRMNVIWACENISMNHPKLFTNSGEQNEP